MSALRLASRRFALTFFIALWICKMGYAQDDLAKQAQNPVASLSAFPLQNNWDFGIGPENRTRYVGLYQPVVPWKLNEDWNLISRMIIPAINSPVDIDGNVHGLGDSILQFYFSPNTEGKFVWGIGPNMLIPTRSDPLLGFGTWGAGVDGVGLVTQGPIVAGALVSQIWGIGGETNPFLLQPFFNYNFSKGYFASLSGEFNADWALPEDQRWSIPFGPGVGRTFAIKEQPLTISTRFAPYLEAPDNGPEWQFRFAVSLLYPKGKK